MENPQINHPQDHQKIHEVCNLFLADILSNIHGFIVVVPNHAGNDLYRFQRSCRPKSPTFYLRAITSSVNFDTGGDMNDFMHGWLKPKTA